MSDNVPITELYVLDEDGITYKRIDPSTVALAVEDETSERTVQKFIDDGLKDWNEIKQGNEYVTASLLRETFDNIEDTLDVLDKNSVRYLDVWDATGQVDFSSIELPVKKGYSYKVIGEETSFGTRTYKPGDLIIFNRAIKKDEIVTEEDVDLLLGFGNEGTKIYRYVADVVPTYENLLSYENPVNESMHSLTIPEMLINIPGLAIDKCEAGWILTLSASHLFNPVWNVPLLEGLRDAVCNEYQLWNYDIGCEATEGGPLEYPMYVNCYRGDAGTVEVSRIPEDELKRHSFYPNHINYTCKFICDRGVSHELVRHRASFAQESTRYCNYASDEFNRSISFIKPTTWDTWEDSCKKQFLDHITASEYIYNYMVYKGLEPQQARAVLPNSLKTEVVMTASIRQWRHFFEIRYYGNAGEPHPDMKHIAGMAHDCMPEDI